MKSKFVSIQATYVHTQIALFDNNTCLDVISNKQSNASSFLVPQLDSLLKKHSLSLSSLSFIAVDKGPGAFTSLRVTIATVNGIAFSQDIPLIGIDGLDALSIQTIENIQKQKIENVDFVVAILNAYNNDVYFSLNKIKGKQYELGVEKGCEKIETLLPRLQEQFSKKIFVFTGNGTVLHQKLIQQEFEIDATMIQSTFMIASAEYIGLLAFQQFQDKKNLTYKIEPNYLKAQYFSVRQPQFNVQRS